MKLYTRTMTSVLSTYLQCSEKHRKEYGEKTIVLMQVGSFYEVYASGGADPSSVDMRMMREFSKATDLKIAAKANMNMLIAGFRDYQIDKYVEKLVHAGYTVPVYEQKAAAGKFTRHLACVHSPGTYTADDDLDMSNSIMCVWIEVNVRRNTMQQAVVCYDSCTTRCVFCEVQRDNYHRPTTYDQIERFVTMHQPSEFVIIGNIPSKQLDEIANYVRCQARAVHVHSSLASDPRHNSSLKNLTKQSVQMHVLEMCHDSPDLVFEEFRMFPIALQAYCNLIDFLSMHNSRLLKYMTPPCYDHEDTSVHVANNAMVQLNIDNQAGGCLATIESILNRCYTHVGRRAFRRMLQSPIADAASINESLDLVEACLELDISTRSVWTNELRNIKNVEHVAYRKAYDRFTPKAACELHSSLRSALVVLRTDFDFDKLRPMQSADALRTGVGEIIAYLERCLDVAAAAECGSLRESVEQTRRIIREGVCADVDAKYTNALKDECDVATLLAFFNHIIKDSETRAAPKKDPVHVHECDRHASTFVTTPRRAAIVLAIVKAALLTGGEKTIEDIAHYVKDLEARPQSAAATSNVSLVSPGIRALMERLRVSFDSRAEAVAAAFGQIVGHIAEDPSHTNTLAALVDIVVKIDILRSKADVVHSLNLTRPKVDSGEPSFVRCEGLRHLLVEKLQTRELYVTNDVALGDCARTNQGALLYGTNAVGKTCLIKAIGVSVVLAQCGMYVPCTSMTIRPYQQIFTRIENHDDIHRGLSTFAVEMSELRTILKYSGPHSLVMGDEMCSGTENVSALSIFMGGVEHLCRVRSSFVFATHFHEITALPQIQDLRMVKLMHMKVVYNPETKALEYDRKLTPGSGDAFYGLEVCKALDLPSEFIERAYAVRVDVLKIAGYTTFRSGELRKSRYNGGKMLGACELCKTIPATQTHHMQHQKLADGRNFITTDRHTFHKNHKANLMSLCDACHQKCHASDSDDSGHYRVKSSAKIKVKKYAYTTSEADTDCSNSTSIASV